MKQIMPAATIPSFPTTDIQLPKLKAKSRRGTQTDLTPASVAADTHIRPSKEFIYETPKREPVRENDDEIMTTNFSRTQIRLVEKTFAL